MNDLRSVKNQLDEQWETQGYFIKKHFFSNEEIIEIKTWVKSELASLDNPNGVHVWWPGKMPTQIEEVVSGERMAKLLKERFRGPVEFLSVKAVFKTGRVSYGSPWHQDTAYWRGTTKVSAWIALDDATRDNGCLRVVPGSHHDLCQHDNHNKDGQFDLRLDDAEIDQSAIVDVSMKAGDVLIFHDRLIHSSFPNQNGADRWSLIPTYRRAGEPDSSTVWTDPKLLA